MGVSPLQVWEVGAQLLGLAGSIGVLKAIEAGFFLPSRYIIPIFRATSPAKHCLSGSLPSELGFYCSLLPECFDAQYDRLLPNCRKCPHAPCDSLPPSRTVQPAAADALQIDTGAAA